MGHRMILALFREYEQVLAACQLVFAMVGMGATLRPSDFAGILEHRRAVLMVLLLQFLLIPPAVVAIGHWLQLPPPVILGLAVLAVMPSGAMSNLFTHLGHGNLALSITATVASTLLCLVGTPVLLQWVGGPLLAESKVSIPAGLVVRDVIFLLLLPMIAGIGIQRLFPTWAPAFSKAAIRASLIVLAVIAVGSLRSGRIDVWEFGWFVPSFLIGLLVLLLLVTRTASYGFGYAAGDAYALAIEVAFRNGNLAILFSSTLFDTATPQGQQLSGGVLYVALFYGGASLVVGAMIVVAQRRLPLMQLQRHYTIDS